MSKERSGGETFDLIVVGGGPAGSTLAALVARQGYRTLLLERERFPRYVIGESLLPGTINGICELLGVGEEIRSAGFPVKLGGTFRWGADADVWSLNFGTSPEIGDPTDSHRVRAYQVDRVRFDRILLDAASRAGVDVRQQHAVRDAIVEGDRIAGVDYTDDAGRRRSARARYVADASGHQSRLHRHLGDRTYSRFYRNVAVFGYFDGGARLPEDAAGHTFFEAFDDGWLWYIPLRDGLTSVGAVVPQSRAGKLKLGHATALQGYIQACPTIRDLLAGVPRSAEAPYDEVRVRKEFSYVAPRFWRPGLALVGDSACFIDVLLSTGVHLATYSALLAARSINTCLAGDLDEATCFDEFELRYRLEFSKMHQLLEGLYDMAKGADTYHAWLRTWLADTHAFGLELGPDPGPDAEPALGLSERVGLLREMNRRSFLADEEGLSMDRVASLPAIETDLVPTADRLRWTPARSPSAREAFRP